MKLETLQELALVRLVDDDEALRDALALMLSYAGWRVEAHADAAGFLRSDRPSAPGCLVLDYLMPGMDGIRLQAQMKSRGYRLPVIFLSGHGDMDVAIECFRGGAADVLKKPVNEEELLALIERLCEKSVLEARGLPGRDELPAIIQGMGEKMRGVLGFMAEGIATAAIAERLSLSEHSVYEYRTRIYKAVGTKDLTELPITEILKALK